METKIESGVQLFSRISSKKESLIGLNEKLCGKENLQNLNIEIISDYATDKNNLLIDFIIRCILPTSLKPCWKNCGVILINTNFQIGVYKIIKTMDQHLKDMNIKNRKEVIENSLKNLIFLDCFDMAQFEISIYSLEDKIKKRPNICCLVLDDITAFYWIKKHENEMLSTYMFSSKVFSLILNVIKGLNIFFLFGRTENNKVNQERRLSRNVDYQIILNKKNGSSYNARVQSYKCDQIITVPFTINNYKVVFE